MTGESPSKDAMSVTNTRQRFSRQLEQSEANPCLQEFPPKAKNLPGFWLPLINAASLLQK